MKMPVHMMKANFWNSHVILKTYLHQFYDDDYDIVKIDDSDNSLKDSHILAY